MEANNGCSNLKVTIMKYFTPVSFLIFLSLSLLFASGLVAQETLNLLKRFDKGLPANGLNGSRLGNVVAFVGDLNNDGYDDWAIGLSNAADYESGETRGKVYIYLGSSTLKSNQFPDILLQGKDSIYNFGYDISLAGDVNGDGYSDMIITNSQYQFLYFGGNPMNLNPVKAFNGFFNTIGLGDINNDGFDDLAVSDRDEVQLFMGATTLKSLPDIILRKRQVSGLGDINKDGFDDIITSDPYFNASTGRVEIYYGGKQTDTIPDMILHGEHAGDQFGSAIAGVGDLNKDGYSEWLVSASNYMNADQSTGRTYIYFGGSLIDTIPDLLIKEREGRDAQSAGDINKDGYNDLLLNQSIYLGGNPMDKTADYIRTEYAQMAVGGDYNHDGYADIIKGYPEDYSMGEGTGCVHVFYGAQQLKSTPDLAFYGAPGYDNFGSSVSAGGDLNNDGYRDFIINAPGLDYHAKVPGTVSVYFGGPVIKDQPDIQLPGKEGIMAGDLNGDGITDMIINNSASGELNVHLGKSVISSTPDYSIKSGNTKMKFNGARPVGDINSDGYDDIAISDAYNSVKDMRVGRVYVFFGGQTMHADPDLILEGEFEFNYFGSSIVSGDLNNDGFSDIIIGAYQYERIDHEGRLYIYDGSSTPDTIPDRVITGERHYQRLGAILAAAGDVNGDGYDDFMAGMPYYGNSPMGVSYVNIYHGGADMDTIADVVIEKITYGLGGSLSTAGDINNDGFDDILVGGNERLGRDDASIYYGGASMDTDADIVIAGQGNWYGMDPSLAFAGDVNKDKHSDLLLGFPYSSAVGAGMGRACLYSSKLENTAIFGIKDNPGSTVYPNPFSSQATIKYHQSQKGMVKVKILNMSGQQIVTLTSGIQSAGYYTCTWHPQGLPDGVYFCTIETATTLKTVKMILQK